ncbi:3-phosphoshikimate 1-carboxyvinyltransferase [Fulvitalea axinellae]|uniref:3-phosphoshikimate 1-carboxyvinyltransferase n=1 Tax=Fulvitalea axinellae TaxID=1182444 RepID=A0AAU9DBW1_9BACT|nr:3-phosphoshikimate 1-carboxyvinyltransferase [Fulvitalea axinellae]
MNDKIELTLAKTPSLRPADIPLPASKSESNRALIINALAGGDGSLTNLSAARDTRTMLRLLSSEDHVLDVRDAGTTMRFLTAYLAVKGQKATLTGTPRMCERPIGTLVDALNELGASLSYKAEDGYPPLEIDGDFEQKTDTLSIRGDVSSQYVSALLMVGPVLERGLTLRLTGKIGSRPYIEMTLALMRDFGAKASFVSDDTIKVEPVPYKTSGFAVESDWSGASYWYAWAGLADVAELKLLGLKKNSLQGDIRIAEIMSELGVKSVFEEDGVCLVKVPVGNPGRIDFSDCPDLAQTVATYCAGAGIDCEMVGLESLRIKETDRIVALQTELGKIGATIEEPEVGLWRLKSDKNWAEWEDELVFDTYDDHRMAMCLSVLASKKTITVKEPGVVAKSYPSFWEDIEGVGVELS